MNMDRTGKRNLLIVTSSLALGGAEIVISNLCRHIDRDRFDVRVCHLKERGPIGEELAGMGFDVVGVEGNRWTKANYLSFLKLRKLIRRYRVDILHSHNTYSLMDSSLCRMTLPGVKSVHTFHFGNYPHLTKKYQMAESVFCRVPDHLVAVGREQMKTLLDTFPIPEDRISTIWNGIDRAPRDPDMEIVRRYGMGDRIIIGTIGNLIEQKGYTHLLDVAGILKTRHPGAVFLIVGDGPLRQGLEEKCRELGLRDTVHFLGAVKNAAARVLPLFDIFFQPSLWEAMSIVVLEAMGEGKPVLATRVGENVHLIEEDLTGMLVDPMDVEGMAAKLGVLITDARRREELGISGRRMFERTCTAEQMARRYEDLYLGILQGKAKAERPVTLSK